MDSTSIPEPRSTRGNIVTDDTVFYDDGGAAIGIDAPADTAGSIFFDDTAAYGNCSGGVDAPASLGRVIDNDAAIQRYDIEACNTTTRQGIIVFQDAILAFNLQRFTTRRGRSASVLLIQIIVNPGRRAHLSIKYITGDEVRSKHVTQIISYVFHSDSYCGIGDNRKDSSRPRRGALVRQPERR